MTADAAEPATEFRVRVLDSVAPYVFCLDNGYLCFYRVVRSLTERSATVIADSNRIDAGRLDSDKLAVTWLQRAGVDLAGMPRAYQRLLETLQAEGRFGIGTLSSKSGLERRLEEIEQAMPADLTGTAAAATEQNPKKKKK